MKAKTINASEYPDMELRFLNVPLLRNLSPENLSRSKLSLNIYPCALLSVFLPISILATILARYGGLADGSSFFLSITHKTEPISLMIPSFAQMHDYLVSIGRPELWNQLFFEHIVQMLINVIMIVTFMLIHLRYTKCGFLENDMAKLISHSAFDKAQRNEQPLWAAYEKLANFILVFVVLILIIQIFSNGINPRLTVELAARKSINGFIGISLCIPMFLICRYYFLIWANVLKPQTLQSKEL